MATTIQPSMHLTQLNLNRSAEQTSRDGDLDGVSSAQSQSQPSTQQSAVVPSFHGFEDVPDGGYGWVIVAACSIITFFFVGLTYSWGVVQAQLTAKHLAKDSSLSFIGSTAASFVAFGALINARILKRIGTRNSALLACFCLGLGQILSGFATTNFGALFVSFGIVLGFGVGLCFMACSSLPAQYFKKRRGLANGFVFAGGGLGGGILSISLNFLIEKVGIPWTFRILGFITLAITMPAAMLLKERTRRATASMEWHLFLDKKFIILFVGAGLGTFPILVPPFFIPLYATSLGASTFLSSALLALFNLSSAVGRLFFGALCDKVGPLSSLLLALILTTISMLAIWPVSGSIAPLVAFIVINGAGNGGFFSTMPSVVGHIYGGARVANAMAMVVTGWAFGYFLGAPVAGWMLDAFGGSAAGRTAFRPAIYFAGSLSLASAVLIMVLRQSIAKKVWVFA